MTTQTPATHFIIQPPTDLLQQHPHIKRMSAELAIAYSNMNSAITNDMLRAVGSALWGALDNKTAFSDFVQAQHPQANKTLVIESSDALLQQLPWETLHHPELGFLGREAGFTLSRRIPGLADYPSPPQRGPLKVLLFTAMTEDQQRLNIEEEQARVQEALLPWISQGIVQLEMPDDGRFSTFQRWLKDFKPQVVFMSGHGQFSGNELSDKDAEAVFLFEAEQGLGSHAVNQHELAQAMRLATPECLVLSACQSGMSSSDNLSAGLLTHLAAQGIPHVIGMRESILDSAGIQFARHFCDAIAVRKSVDTAIQTARAAMTQPLKGYLKDQTQHHLATLGFGQWCLPCLYSQNPERALIDWDFVLQKPEVVKTNTTLNQISLPKRFIGRRLQLREWPQKLLAGGYQQLQITGPGGQGKTALAGKLSMQLQQRGYTVLACSARDEAAWDEFQFECQMLLDAEHVQQYDRMLPRCQDEAARAKLMLRLLAKQFTAGLVFFFDNLETVQDPTNRTLTDKNYAAWIEQIQTLQAANIRLIITSRWQLPDWPQADHLSLVHFSYNDYLQLARQNQLPDKLTQDRDRLREVHRTLHGNARALEFFAAALPEMTADEEADFLAALQQARAESQVDMALQMVYQHRSAAAQGLLNLLTAYHTPVPVEGVIRLALSYQQSSSDSSAANLQELIDVSLMEQSYAHDLQTIEYQCSPVVSEWLATHTPAPTPEAFQTAANYQHYLFQHQRHTLPQAIIGHQAYQRAGENNKAHRLALDTIIGHLSMAGLYNEVLENWLPDICQSGDKKIRGDALGQTGKQYHHIGDYETALKYLQQSLAIQQEIGDKSGEGTTLNNISQIFKARGDYETALKYLQQSLAIQQEIGDVAGLCATLFNMGHIHAQNEQMDEAVSAWITVYQLAKKMNLAQALDALANLAPQLGLPAGLEGWEALAQQKQEQE